MVLLVFLVDTSASMNQRTCLGTSYLDLAKGAVESFLKIRARDTNNIRGDRYMLVTYDEMNKSIKAGWKENLQDFLRELKNLAGHGMSNIGRALRETFDLLNINRLQSGIDHYGMGRNPYYLEPALVLLLTDGCSALDIDGIINEITMPTHDLLPGGELTKELYRWDQRLFTILMKIPGISCNSMYDKNTTIQPEDLLLSNLCDQTGGKLYSIGSQKNLMQTLESVAQKIMVPGVIINFDKYGPDPQEVVQEVQDHLKSEEELQNKINCNGPLNNCVSGADKDIGYNNFQPGNVNGFINGQGILPSPFIPPPSQRGFSKNMNSGGKAENKTTQNGIIDGHGNTQIKTEGISSSLSPIPGIPIRGNDEQAMDGNVLSPNPGTPTNTAWYNQRRMIYVRSIKGTVGHWPIPESFWPESTASRLSPRDCQPVVRFTCKPVDAMVIENLPFDKYELEPSPLTQYILERRQPNAAWQTFVSGSSLNSEIGYPFGYLKAATNLQCVNFFVMPYNYPVIMPLLDELFKIHKGKPNLCWRQSFNEYLQTVPAYYYIPLRNALKRMGAPINLIPDQLDGSLSFSVVAYLKKLKHQAKAEFERLISLHSQRNEPEPNTAQTIPRVPQLIDGKHRDFKDLLIQKTTNYRKKDGGLSISTSKKEAPFEKRCLPNCKTTYSWQTFRNPFDIRHNEVIERVAMMRVNFFHATTMSMSNRLVGDDSRHGVSIAQMGNYQDHVQQHKPLREVDPSQVRVHPFGNPFKLKQDQIIAVDEADVTENMQLGQNARKRNGEIMMNSLQKGKRKRSETPPPSRRPVGTVPNTPPPRLPGKLNDENDKRSDIFKTVPDSKGVLKDLALSSDEPYKANNINIDNKEKKPSVNRQLRKLQLMHRNKKENHEHTLNDSNKYEEISDYLEGSSPILSILRTSLEEPEDKDNDELLIINESSTNSNGGDNVTFTYDENRSSSASNSSHGSSALNKTPVSSVITPLNIDELFVNHTKDALAKIYTQLHHRKVVRTRLSVWQAIRERVDFSRIADMVKGLPVDVEAKLMFTLNMIREAEKFHLETLEKKFKKLLSEL